MVQLIFLDLSGNVADDFIERKYIPTSGLTQEPKGIIGEGYWPSHVFKSFKFKEGEIRCAELCVLHTAQKSCHFYYFVKKDPGQGKNVCQLGDFGQNSFQDDHYPDITSQTIYQLRSNFVIKKQIEDVTEFGKCLNEGYYELNNGDEIEIGTTYSSFYKVGEICEWAFYAPDAVGITYEITKFKVIHA